MRKLGIKGKWVNATEAVRACSESWGCFDDEFSRLNDCVEPVGGIIV